jgi:hypothetical protein
MSHPPGSMISRDRSRAAAGRPGPPHRPGRAGLRRPASVRCGRHAAAAPARRTPRRGADRLGERPVALALPARVQPARELPARRPRRPDGPAARGLRVLGARGILPAGPPPAVPALAHGGGRAARVGQHGPAAARPPRLRRGGPRARPHGGPAQGRRPARGQAGTVRGDVGLARGQGRARVAVLHRRGHGDPPDDELREGLRPHRPGAAGRRPRDAHPRPRRRDPGARAHRVPRPRRGHRTGPAGLLPAQAGGRPTGVPRPGSTPRHADHAGSVRGRC